MTRQQTDLARDLYERTSGRLRLCTRRQIEAAWPAKAPGAPRARRLRDLADVGPCRKAVQEQALNASLGAARAEEFAAAAHEAAANAVDHGDRGAVSVEVRGGKFRVRVADRGRGIPLDVLPQALLEMGWTTKPEDRGFGWGIILAASNRVFLSTGKSGTVVILECDL